MEKNHRRQATLGNNRRKKVTVEKQEGKLPLGRNLYGVTNSLLQRLVFQVYKEKIAEKKRHIQKVKNKKYRELSKELSKNHFYFEKNSAVCFICIYTL